MKNLLSMLLVFSFLFTIGCEDDDATNPLVGVWNMTSMVYVNDGETTNIDASNDYSIVMIFNEDGTYSNQGTMDGVGHSESGTWSTQGNKLTTIVEGETTIWDYTLSGSSLSISLTEDAGARSLTYNFTKE
tara:strand:- start:53 stop:445 length:393 start_codon:yes stop_codon:yes gene_type:complete